MENEMQVQGSVVLSARDIQARVNLIQSVMKQVMEDGVHFGTIPGCPKPSLYKAGAEKLATTFQIAIDSSVEDLSTPDEKRYRVTCIAYSASGVKLGSSTGECSSSEEKYKWRKPVCLAEFEAAEFDRKREKWSKDGTQTKQVRTEPSDQANTILQMADKRAYVAVVRKVTAASDIFTQDIEDLGDNFVADEKPAVIQKPSVDYDALAKVEFKSMQSKFKGFCKACSKDISQGSDIMYNKTMGTFHPACLKKPEPKPQDDPTQPGSVTPQILKNLEKMAVAAKVKLIDRIGQDGHDSLTDLKMDYVNDLFAEFAAIVDAEKDEAK